jgi:hypothetical protein
MLTFVMGTEDFPFVRDVSALLRKATPILGSPDAIVLCDFDGRTVKVRYLERIRAEDDGIEFFENPQKLRGNSLRLEGDCVFLESQTMNLPADLFLHQEYNKRTPEPGCLFRLVRLSLGQKVELFTLDEKFRNR